MGCRDVVASVLLLLLLRLSVRFALFVFSLFPATFIQLEGEKKGETDDNNGRWVVQLHCAVYNVYTRGAYIEKELVGPLTLLDR